MSEGIDKALKKISAGTATTKTRTSSTTERRPTDGLPGDPNCPYCHGIGFLRLEVPVGHPSFGKLELCVCRQKQVVSGASRRLYEMSNLDKLSSMTFETFKPRGLVGLAPIHAESLETAYKSARHFAEHVEGWLLLQGGYGCGKTHLVAAIANFVVSLGVPTLFITVPDMLDSLRAGYNDPEADFESRFDEIRQVRLLVLDDFGTQNATPWAQEKLFQIINYRYINHLPTVITTNLRLSDIEGRIRSRLQDPNLVTRRQITAPDFRNPTEEPIQGEINWVSLDVNQTFDTFNERSGEGITAADLKTLHAAYDACRRFAEKPEGWLLLIGGFGVGKTHLAAAVANQHKKEGNPFLFIDVLDLLEYLRATFNPSSNVRFDRRFEEIRSTPLLVLDSLTTQSSSPWVKEKLYQIINYRYVNRLPTIMTSTESLREMDDRLRTRVKDKRLCEVLIIEVPPFTDNPNLRKPRLPRARR